MSETTTPIRHTFFTAARIVTMFAVLAMLTACAPEGPQPWDAINHDISKIDAMGPSGSIGP